MLWKLLPHPSPAHVVRMFSRKADSRGGDFARSITELRHWASHVIDRNVYVAPNPTVCTSGDRHSARDVTHWSFFLVDIDPIEKKYNIQRATEHVINALSNMVRDVSGEIYGRPIVIDSGRGAQLWYRLPDVLLSDAVPEGRIVDNSCHRKTARKINGYWLAQLAERVGMTNGCKIDCSVSDLPRVMRCPGTFNLKTKKMAKFLEPTDRVFTDLPRLLLQPIPQTALIDPPRKPGVPGQKWQKAFHKLTFKAQTYLLEGKEEPGRHQTVWHTARKLQEVGVTRDEADRAITRANGLKGKVQELSRGEIEHALDTAYLDSDD